jgi:hypothetical protein
MIESLINFDSMRGTVDHQEKLRSRHTAAVYSTVLIHFARNMVIRTEKLTAFATAHLWEMRRSSFAWNLNYLASCEIMWWRGSSTQIQKWGNGRKILIRVFFFFPRPPSTQVVLRNCMLKWISWVFKVSVAPWQWIIIYSGMLRSARLLAPH